MRNLFKRFFGETDTFHSSCLKVTEGSSASWYHGYQVSGPKVHAIYEKDGIYIEYYRRMTSHLGDTDVMTDRIVRKDGVTLYKDLYA